MTAFKPLNHGAKWSEDDKEKVFELYKKGWPYQKRFFWIYCQKESLKSFQMDIFDLCDTLVGVLIFFHNPRDR